MVPDLSDEKIAALLAVKKRVVKQSKTLSTHSTGQDLLLSGDDGETYKAYTRQGLKLADAFSCGLRWCPRGADEVTLIRVNGSNHSHPNVIEGTETGYRCHIHIATARYIQVGHRAEGYAEATSDYSTLDGAMAVLALRANIEGKPFAEIQRTLF